MTVLEEIALRQSIRFGLLVLGLIAALIYAVAFCYRGPSAAKTLVKSIPLLSFGLAGLASFAHPLIIYALFLSALGDIALSRNGQRAFLMGLISFALAHVMYIAQFWHLAGGIAPAFEVPILPVLVILFALSTEWWLAPHTKDMRWPVRVYVLLIALMGLLALGLPGMFLATFGAFAFLASDAILALQVFRLQESSKWQVPASVTLWLLYVGGQFAILAGAGWSTPLFQFT